MQQRKYMFACKPTIGLLLIGSLALGTSRCAAEVLRDEVPVSFPGSASDAGSSRTAGVKAKRAADDTKYPIYIVFDILDDKTVSSLCGARISRDFYVVKASFSNRLGQNEKGKSLLACGDSIYARVSVEKQEGTRRGNAEWSQATPTDFGGAILHYPQEGTKEATKPPESDQNASVIPDGFRVMPYSFSMIVTEALDRNKGRLTDGQIRNIILAAMQPVEEVPFGQTVTRLLFFPRQPFPEKNQHRFRISEIYTGFFQSMVPIVANRNLESRNIPALQDQKARGYQ